MPGTPTQPSARQTLLIIALAIAAYWPALHLPFISDDWSQIPIAREYATAHWTPLVHDLNFRTRATYMFLDATLDRAFGFTPLPFYVASLILHILCCLMILRLDRWTAFDRPARITAAAFFAVYEGHQEAVMWVAAASDLLVTLFALITLIAWLRWLAKPSALTYGLALLSFLGALASKESAWIVPALLVIPLFPRDEPASNPTPWARRLLLPLAPFFALSALYIAWSWFGRVAHPEFHDIRFSVWSPWPLVLLRSLWRLLFPWGLLALGLLLWTKGPRASRRPAVEALAWAAVALIPYCFLTYMKEVPSRHTYLASVGLSLLVGLAASALFEARRQAILIACAIAVLGVNLEILWVKKLRQFSERAQPSELLRLAAAAAVGPITIDCNPLGDYTAGAVLRELGAQSIFPPRTGPPPDPACFALQYTDRAGNVVHVRRSLRPASRGLFR